jgi:hypothetical protein
MAGGLADGICINQKEQDNKHGRGSPPSLTSHSSYYRKKLTPVKISFISDLLGQMRNKFVQNIDKNTSAVA